MSLIGSATISSNFILSQSPVMLPVFQNVSAETLEITESLARTRGEAGEGIPTPSISNARVRKSTQKLFKNILHSPFE